MYDSTAAAIFAVSEEEQGSRDDGTYFCLLERLRG